MRLILYTLLTICTLQPCIAQENYDIDLIPSTLRNRANAVIRNEETVVDMRSPNNVIYSVKQAITVLNKNGEDNARLILFYDKNTAIKGVKGEVYNQTGNQIGKFTLSNFIDESAVHDFSLFEDSRVKHFLPAVNTYPYTVVYSYEIRFKQNLIIPDWRPKPANEVSVAHSSYQFICKPTDKIRLKVQHIANAKETIDEKQKSLVWKVENLISQKEEPYSPDRDSYQPIVKIAPEQFTYFNYNGSYTNWQELGKWYYDNLLKNRNSLSASTIQTLKDLVAKETTDKAKAKKIYEFMQNKTRYISVQIGIGGFQPFTAAEVDRLGYGDCKALVNYMQSLLSAVDIDSYYCVVQAGSQKKSLAIDFASMNQGNHIILCLPLKGDTVWLECTSQKAPFGFLGDFTDDRYVLACTPQGGKLLKTPKLKAQANLQVRNASLVISDEGNVTGAIKTTFSGAQYDNRESVIYKPTVAQPKLLAEIYDIDNITFDNISFTQHKNIEPELVENLNLSIKKYAAVNNDKMFLTPNLFNIKSTVPDIRNRILPIYINRGYADIDTVTFELPERFIGAIETKDKNIVTEFGTYFSTIKLDGRKLIYIRQFTLFEGTYHPTQYTNYSKFIADVNVADYQKLIFNLKK